MKRETEGALGNTDGALLLVDEGGGERRGEAASAPGSDGTARESSDGTVRESSDGTVRESSDGTAFRSAKRSRHVPAAVTREVYLRDGGQCTFVAKDGRRCAAPHFLELDHVEPWALGGASEAENLRLRCRAHNQQHARKLFGRQYMAAAVAGSRAAAGEGAPRSET